MPQTDSQLSPEFEHPLLSIPGALKRWPSWAAWSAPQKRPLDLRRALRAASTNAPDTWAPYDVAMRHLQRAAPPLPYHLPIPLGVGILIAPPLLFVDFDDLYDGERALPPWASQFIERAHAIGAYVEASAGGDGLHVILQVSPELILRRNRYTRSHPTGMPVGIELYTQERFCALTGIAPAITHERVQSEELNSPTAGDALAQAFIAELGAHAAPVLTPDLPPAPTSVPAPTQMVLDLLTTVMTPGIREAFENPAQAYALWQNRRHLSSADSSLSSWRFALYIEACRQSPVSPAPVYELFNPQTEPMHPGIPQWQEFSGHNKKLHRRYADIQRAHALVAQEFSLLSEELGLAPRPEEPPAQDPHLTSEADPSWVQLGLVMRVNKAGHAKPLPSSVNYIRILSRHPLFSKHKIERNKLDGVTLCDRIPLTDTQITRWREPLRAVLDMPVDPSAQDVRDAVEVIADDNPYDPLVEYLDNLPAFTPSADYSADSSALSGWLEKVGATPGPDTKMFARRILLGLVARAVKPGVKFDYIPVFEGPQGVGKSSLVKAIVSPTYYATLFGGLASKDAPMTLRGRWGVELAELVAFKKTDNETMKSFFATDTDVFRPPYARNMVTIPRRTIMFGTTNDAQYLTDHTGSRRYWSIFFARMIDIAWFTQNRDALFAEALYFYKQGERFHDTLEETQAEHRQRAMQARLVTPAWQIKLLQHLQNLPKPHLANDNGMSHSGFLTPAYVASLQSTLNLPPSIAHMNSAQLAHFLYRAGYVHLSLSYRPTNAMPTKLIGWGHPALARIPPDEQRAFLSNFPTLFKGNQAPPAWLMQQGLLEQALMSLMDAPDIQALDFGADTE